MKRVNTFVDYRTELVEESSKKAETELEENSKKVDEDKEIVELQSLIEVVPDEEEVAIDVIPLATKPLTIVDWKIHKEGKKSYYQIIRADGKSQMYRVFSQYCLGRKAYLLKDKQIRSVGVFDEVFSTWMAFGGNTRDLGSFGEETDKIMDLHQIHEEVLFTKRGDGVAGIKRRRHDLSSDGIRDLATALGRGRLKEDLESST
ncbi:hypothetical protein Tco_1456156 [Tanacetum coccineum]